VSVNDPAYCFFGHFSHDTIIVTPSFGFVSVLKSCYLVLFKRAKCKKKNKKKAGDEKILSPNIYTVRALEKIIETDLRSYSAGLPFSFFLTF
jgi:hypothetical protein